MKNIKDVYNYINNNFDLITVTEKRNNNIINKFVSSGIKTYQSLDNISFERFCADSFLPDDFVTGALRAENGDFIIDCDKTKYIITPLKKKTAKKKCVFDESKITDLFLDDLINSDLADKERIEIKNNNTVIIPINRDAIGITSLIQELRLASFINHFLDGSAEKYQVCRVPAFSVEFYGSDYKIYGYIYSLETNQNISNPILLYDSEKDFNKLLSFDSYANFAHSFLT